MEKKTGIYICSGCDIGSCIDTDSLNSLVVSEYNPVLCKNHTSFCSMEGISIIQQDIEQKNLTDIVIGACSPRVHFDTFDFGEKIICERVN